MFNGKLKAVTFSYDDGIKQDIRLIELFNKYNLKGTFNLNSGYLGLPGCLDREGKKVEHNRIKAEDIKYVYQGHEVAVHTLTHPTLPSLENSVVTRQVEIDRQTLSDIVGYEVVGMAYPCGGANNDNRVAEVIENTTGVKYSRTITSTHNFELQKNMYRFNPSVYHMDADKMFELGREFIELRTDTPKIFYIWGHSFEFDFSSTINWEKMEEFLKLISNRADIFYGTNKEVLLDRK